MERYESSKIAFATIADYLVARDLRPRGQLARPSGMWGSERPTPRPSRCSPTTCGALSAADAPIVADALDALAATFESEYGDGPVVAAARLGELADRLLGAADHLLRGPVANPALIDEGTTVDRGLRARRTCPRTHRTARRVGPTGDTDGRERASALSAAAAAARVRVFGDVLDMTLADMTAAPTSMPETVSQRGGILRSRMPSWLEAWWPRRRIRHGAAAGPTPERRHRRRRAASRDELAR